MHLEFDGIGDDDDEDEFVPEEDDDDDDDDDEGDEEQEEQEGNKKRKRANRSDVTAARTTQSAFGTSEPKGGKRKAVIPEHVPHRCLVSMISRRMSLGNQRRRRNQHTHQVSLRTGRR